MADEEEEPTELEAEVPVLKEAFVTTERADEGNKTSEHMYDGYELLLDIDESALDDYLPAPTGQCCHGALSCGFLFALQVHNFYQPVGGGVIGHITASVPASPEA